MTISFVRMTLSGGVMILVVAAIRAVLMNKLPKRTFMALWAAVMIRLIVPFGLPVAVSLPNILPERTVETPEHIPDAFDAFTEPVQAYKPEYEAENGPESDIPDHAPAEITVPEVTVPASEKTEGTENKSVLNTDTMQEETVAPTPQVIVDGSGTGEKSVPVLPVIWGAGAVLSAAVFTALYIHGYRKFGQAVPVENDICELWLRKHRLKRKLRICQYRRDIIADDLWDTPSRHTCPRGHGLA